MATLRKFHFIGIGGIGMSSLAKMLLERNYEVSGSDISDSPITEALAALGATISIGHAAQNVPSEATVIYSSGIRKDNPEYLAAQKLNCPILHRSELLWSLTEGCKALAVTGTHGKTTTSSLLAWTLTVAGFDPSFSVGGIVSNFHTNGKWGKGNIFVLEADESDGSFLRYAPHGAIVTNIGLDHMDHFKSEGPLMHSFASFMSQVQSKPSLFLCVDDARLCHLNPGGVSYGFSPGAHLQVLNFFQDGWTSRFDICYKEKTYPNIRLGLVGPHNALNASAVFGLALAMGASESNIRQAFNSFTGVARRCEKKGKAQGALFVDDYAHHPTEIRATLLAIRQAAPKNRLIALFQPHRFTRTRDCMGSYRNIFDDVDLLLITDIYPAGESPIPGVSAQQILDEVARHSPQLTVRHVPYQELVGELQRLIRPGDVVVTLGAGNITKIGPEVIASYEAVPAR